MRGIWLLPCRRYTNATSGPVSTTAKRVSPESLQVIWVRGEIRHSRIDDSAGLLRQVVDRNGRLALARTPLQPPMRIVRDVESRPHKEGE